MKNKNEVVHVRVKTTKTAWIGLVLIIACIAVPSIRIAKDIGLL